METFQELASIPGLMMKVSLQVSKRWICLNNDWCLIGLQVALRAWERAALLHAACCLKRPLNLLQGEAPVLELLLPGLDAGKISIHSDDQICHANAESRALPEEDWRLLEAPLLAGMPVHPG